MTSATLETAVEAEASASAKPAATGADRRVFPRSEHAYAIPSGDWSHVVDISVGGACLEGDEPVKTGDRFELILTDERAFYTAMIEAEVMWRRGPRVGLRWVVPEEKHQEWLKKRCSGG